MQSTDMELLGMQSTDMEGASLQLVLKKFSKLNKPRAYKQYFMAGFNLSFVI